MKFFVNGKTVQLYRYVLTYMEAPDEVEEGAENTGTDPDEPIQVTTFFATEAEARRLQKEFGGDVSSLDTSDVEWMDGIIVQDSPNPMAEAVKIYEMGREAWEAKQAAPTTEERMAQMEADIAYLAMLTDTDMEV